MVSCCRFRGRVEKLGLTDIGNGWLSNSHYLPHNEIQYA